MSVKKVKEELDFLLSEKYRLDKKIKDKQRKLIKEKSKLKFKCHSCNESNPYSETILFKSYWLDKGLGYEEDTIRFSEYHIVCASCGIHHRFLSDKSIVKYEIPHEVKNYYGKDKIFQKEYDSNDFLKKFKEVVVNDPDRSPIMNSTYHFINL